MLYWQARKMRKEEISNIPRFAGLSGELTRMLAEHSSMKEAAEGEILFHEGDPCRRMYVIRSGRVKICKYLSSGKELILDVFSAGEAIGEVAVLDGDPYPATAIAIEQVLVIALPRNLYIRLLADYPELAMSTIRDLTLRMRELSHRIQVLAAGSVEQRVACVLRSLNLVTESMEIRISRQDLANLTGARLESVVRALKPLERSGVLQTGRNRIRILDQQALEALAADIER